MPSSAAGRAYVLFDGFCNVCNGWATFVYEQDARGQFELVPLQSEEGIALLEAHGLVGSYIDSLVMIEGERVFLKSDAALRVLRLLGGLWGVLSLARVFPKGLRDWFYDRVAEARYRMFGKRTVCEVRTRRRKK